MRRILAHKKLLLTVGIMLLLAGLGWSQRTPVLTWYLLRELANIDEDNRAAWVDRAASLDWATVPGLLDRLNTKNPTIANNIEAALVAVQK